MSCLGGFLGLDRDFSDFFGRVETKSRFLDLDRDISIVETNFLKLSRLTFFRCQIESLDRDHVETNRDPQPYIYLDLS